MTAPLPEDSVFYHVATQTPARLASMADIKAPRDTYGFYFLEEAIRQAGGVFVYLQNLISLRRTCKDLRKWMTNSTTDEHSRELHTVIRQKQLETAMQYVVFGNQAMAEKLVKADPSLLLEKNTLPVTDISGKPVVGKTLLQAALCAGDVANTPGEICMAEMLAGYLKALPNSSKEMKDQVEEIFPEGVDAHVANQKEKAVQFKDQILTPLIEAIIAADDVQINEMHTSKRAGSQLGQAFNRFRGEIERLSFEDEVFNPYYLLEAFTLYNARFDEFEPLGQWSKRDLFCVQGIGFIQRFLPACYLQAFAQSLYDITGLEAKLSRKFTFKYPSRGAAACAVDSISSLRGLGFNYWAVLGEGQARRCGGGWCEGVGPWIRGWPAVLGPGGLALLEFFVKQKASGLSSLCGTPNAQIRAVL